MTLPKIDIDLTVVEMRDELLTTFNLDSSLIDSYADVTRMEAGQEVVTQSSEQYDRKVAAAYTWYTYTQHIKPLRPHLCQILQTHMKDTQKLIIAD